MTMQQTGKETKHSYDGESKLAAVTDENGSQVVGYSYDADGNLSERTVLRNNLTATYTYDYQNHLTAMKNQTGSEIVPMLADRGSYIASESTFYKVLKEFLFMKV